MSKIHFDDTITALATPPGEGGLAVIRISGPEALLIAEQSFKSRSGKKIGETSIQTALFGNVADKTGKKLDEVLTTFFKTPHSYTGEDVIEISCHGGMRVTKAIVELLIKGGARLAEPGEFTRRAFLNGRIDLVQAEAVLDVIRAKTDDSLEQAERQLRGELSREFQTIRTSLVELHAEMEVNLDFSEEDKDVVAGLDIKSVLQEVRGKIEKLLTTFKRGRLLRDGLSVALVGKPNVGKSSLLNKLLQRERAIVTDIPGTTRDTIEEWVEIGGFPVKLIDTAGIAETEDPVEKIGISRTKQALQDAGLVLVLLDGSGEYDEQDQALFNELPAATEKILCVTKSDLPQKINLPRDVFRDDSILYISAFTNKGLDELEERILSVLEEGRISSESILITNTRHADCLSRSLDALGKTESGLSEGLSHEFITEDLKVALQAIGEVVGEVYTEDLLGVIFSRFCIGK